MQFQISLFIVLILVLVPVGVIIWLIMRLLKKVDRKSVVNESGINDNQLKLEQLKMQHEEKMLSKKLSTPLKIQAMERLVLFLERLEPQQLVSRNLEQGMELRTFHLRLLHNIREEFEHNLAQQLYISKEAWVLVQNARDEVVKQINVQVSNLPENAEASLLATALVTLHIAIIDEAVDTIQAEFQKL